MSLKQSIRSAITISLVEESRGGPFVFLHEPAQACATVADLGFDAVEIFPPSAEALRTPEIQNALKTHHLGVAAVGTGAGWIKHKLRLTDPDEGIRKRALHFVHGIIDVAGEFGAPVIIGSMQGRWGDGHSREAVLAWLSAALQDLNDYGRQRGSIILYEPLNRYETNLFNRQEEAAIFLKSIQTENVLLLCDLFHMNIEEGSMAESLRTVAAQIGHVHFADSNRQAIGFGHTNIAPIAQILTEIQYAGYVSAECLPLPDPLTAARQTMRSFKQWFG